MADPPRLPPAGYSGKPLAEKLGVKPGGVLTAVDPPAHYARLVEPLPAGARWEAAPLGEGAAGPVVHAFFASQGALAAAVATLAAWPPPGGMIWVSWPKRTSPMFRDLTEDGVRALLLPTGWVDVKVAAVDADWSGLKFLRRRT